MTRTAQGKVLLVTVVVGVCVCVCVCVYVCVCVFQRHDGLWLSESCSHQVFAVRRYGWVPSAEALREAAVILRADSTLVGWKGRLLV